MIRWYIEVIGAQVPGGAQPGWSYQGQAPSGLGWCSMYVSLESGSQIPSVWTGQGIGAELKRLPLEPAGTFQYPGLEGAVGAENGS